MMKYLKFLIFFSLFNLSSTYAQKFSKKEVDENFTIIDTSSISTFFSNGQLKLKQDFVNGEFKTNTGAYKLKRPIYSEKYWKNGQLRQYYIYENYNCVKTEIFTKKGSKDYLYIMQYPENKEFFVKITNNFYVDETSNSFTLYSYYKGNTILKGQYLDGKKNGIWEFYNNKSGDITKKITWDKGKKVKVEKF